MPSPSCVPSPGVPGGTSPDHLLHRWFQRLHLRLWPDGCRQDIHDGGGYPLQGAGVLLVRTTPLPPSCFQVSGGTGAELVICCVSPKAPGLKRGAPCPGGPETVPVGMGWAGALPTLRPQAEIPLMPESRPDRLEVSQEGLSFRLQVFTALLLFGCPALGPGVLG